MKFGELTMKNKVKLTEDQMDEIVEAQADDDSAWGKPICVRKESVPTVEKHLTESDASDGVDSPGSAV
jgi:hypothetical protein